MVPAFYFHPLALAYDFGRNHPLKPVRLQRTLGLLELCVPDIDVILPSPATVDELLTVHDETLVEAVLDLSEGRPRAIEEIAALGFSNGDTPPFPGMHSAAAAYCGASLAAARAVVQGERVAFNISGGLHHAKAGRANGFCVYNDVALAAVELRKRFDRVLCIDIDLHHGDGTEAIFDADPHVATYSIHESGRTLYPGTGFVHDRGRADTSFNVPLQAGTTGDTWLWAIRQTLPALIEFCKPDAIVLQAGCDAHITDPLGHLNVRTQDWWAAVKMVRAFDLPTVVLGGGGYNLQNVPRMWAGLVLTMAGIDIPESLPDDVPEEWGLPEWRDPVPDDQGKIGLEEAERAVGELRERFSSETRSR